MSNVNIDDPKRLLELADCMSNFQKSFDLCRLYISNSVQSTISNLTAKKSNINSNIQQIELEICSLNHNYNICIQNLTEGGNCNHLYQQIRHAESSKAEYQKLLNKIISLENHIQFVYSNKVKPREQELNNLLRHYPKAINGLFQMEKLLQDYLKFSFIISQINSSNKIIGANGTLSSNNPSTYIPTISMEDLSKEYYDKKSSWQLSASSFSNHEKLTVDANDIIVFENWNANTPDFWQHHGKNKQMYRELFTNKEDLDRASQVDPIMVYKYKGKYVQENDGSHRIAMAQELGIHIEVEVCGEYFDKDN